MNEKELQIVWKEYDQIMKFPKNYYGDDEDNISIREFLLWGPILGNSNMKFFHVCPKGATQ